MPHERDTDAALRSMGIGANELAVYRALLSLGQTGASAIARQSGLHGQIVYRSLDTLEELGLVNRTKVNGRNRFSAHAPEKILTTYDERRAVLVNAVKTLGEAQTPPLMDDIRVYQGREAFIDAEFALIEEMPNNTTLHVITGTMDQYEAVLGSHLIAYDCIKVKKNIRMQTLCPESQRKACTFTDRPLIEFRTLAEEFVGNINMGIYNGQFGIYLFTEPVSSIVIRNKSVTDSYRNFFAALWRMGK